MFQITEEEKRKMKQLSQEKFTAPQICSALGREKKDLYCLIKYMKNNNIPFCHKLSGISEYEEEIIDLYLSGLTLKQISYIFKERQITLGVDKLSKVLKYYISGYIDGDGSLSYYKGKRKHKEDWLGFNLNITGTKETCEFILKYFNKEKIKLTQRYPNRGKNNYSLNIQGNEQLFNLLSPLYEDEYLKRVCVEYKRDNYLILREQIMNKHNI